jgi:hypothetical protein
MIKKIFILLNALLVLPLHAGDRWPVEKAQVWYAQQPWLVGANFLPSTAINQLEMWQAETFDPATIDRELGWAHDLGMNTMRVFLHDLVWEQNPDGLYHRMDQFLNLCKKHGIRPIFVFFDDCHFPSPQLGAQPLPVPRFHNSGWVNSPARELAVRYSEGKATTNEVKRLRGYIQDTMSHFAQDPRVLMWELYNEPGRGAGPLTGQGENQFGDQSAKLLADAWVWAREVSPSQPICSTGRGCVGEENLKLAYENSDVISFHTYEKPEETEKIIADLQTNYPGRPIICTEYMARQRGSTFQEIMPILKTNHVGAINWGLVAGKSGTIWPWSSRQGKNVDAMRAAGEVVKPGEAMPEPKLWFHDILRPDGSPFSTNEVKFIREITGIGES